MELYTDTVLYHVIPIESHESHPTCTICTPTVVPVVAGASSRCQPTLLTSATASGRLDAVSARRGKAWHQGNAPSAWMSGGKERFEPRARCDRQRLSLV